MPEPPQYRYHDVWRVHRDREKFEHMLECARAMPALRRCIAAHLAEDGLTRERVLACAVRLLDLGFFRIGGEDGAEENQTYGLATMPWPSRRAWRPRSRPASAPPSER